MKVETVQERIKRKREEYKELKKQERANAAVDVVKSVEVKPVEVKPVEVKPVEVKPVEVKPVEVKRADNLKNKTLKLDDLIEKTEVTPEVTPEVTLEKPEDKALKAFLPDRFLQLSPRKRK